jgi:protoporphyrinogen oxidase
MKKNVIIIGAGPAGLTAAYEFLKTKEFKVTILEESNMIGGISRTINHNGNRIDIGGHRFFSKIEKVNNWWDEVLEEKFLIRNRKSRILYERNFYDYPISLNTTTIKNLGLLRFIKIGFSYLKSIIFKREEKTLEDFFINRFGYELYTTFFRDYTEKVWGVPCNRIDALFGHQRIKGLSIKSVLIHMLKKAFGNINSKNIETSLIEQFQYPKLGPGQLWEDVANKIKINGGNIIFDQSVNQISSIDNNLESLTTENGNKYQADYILSSMPIKDLVNSIDDAPNNITTIANNLEYRDFITVGLLVKNLELKNLEDNWIYIQELDVKIGRLQIFNNWSPYLVKDKSTTWIGLEYFCNEHDELWNMNKDEFIALAISEMIKLNIIKKENLLDSIQIKVKKAYPSYFGSYDKFDDIKQYLNDIENLYCIGRNGQHRYNNMDHSMLTSFEAVESIINGTSKNKLWDINTEKEYHETSDKK